VVEGRQLLHPTSPMFLLALFTATMVIALIAFECGFRFGRWRSRQPDPEPLMPARVLVTSTLGLLAFLLGFTFGLASDHFDSRNEFVFDEALSIATSYHRADFLQDPERTKIRHLLRKYVGLRLEANRSAEVEGSTIAELRRLQGQIWSEAVAAAKKVNGPLSAAPLLQSLTEVFDVRGERALDGFRARIPLKVWLFLYIIMTISIAAAGFQSGLAGARRSLAVFGYALVFASVILMIIAGDTPGSTQIRSNRQILLDLQARMPAP